LQGITCHYGGGGGGGKSTIPYATNFSTYDTGKHLLETLAVGRYLDDKLGYESKITEKKTL